MNPHDEGYKFFQPERFLEKIHKVQREFAGELKILKGVEFGEPYLYPEALSSAQQQDYDLIIGSVHMLDKFFVGTEEALAQYGAEGLIQRYYTTMLEMVQAGGFDTLAHFNLPERYHPVALPEDSLIDEILTCLVRAGIALEVNTSSLRKGLTESLPDRKILRRYVEFGGTMITIGSDAHYPEDVGAGFDYVQNLLQEFPQFRAGYFEQRRFISQKALLMDHLRNNL
jgi:histidinol-phosphatase (PHP family)